MRVCVFFFQATADLTRKASVEIQLSGDAGKLRAELFDMTGSFEHASEKAKRFEALYNKQASGSHDSSGPVFKMASKNLT